MTKAEFILAQLNLLGAKLKFYVIILTSQKPNMKMKYLALNDFIENTSKLERLYSSYSWIRQIL